MRSQAKIAGTGRTDPTPSSRSYGRCSGVMNDGTASASDAYDATAVITEREPDPSGLRTTFRTDGGAVAVALTTRFVTGQD